jgi:hypothetical protein
LFLISSFLISLSSGGTPTFFDSFSGCLQAIQT